MGYDAFGFENAPDGWAPGDPAPEGSEAAQQTAERMEAFGEHVHDGAVAEAGTALAAHTGDTVAAHAATAISVAPTGGISATTAQAAIAELDTEKQAVSAKGQANGYASLGSDGKVPDAQLPPAQSGSDLDADAVRVIARQRAAVALRGTIAKEGYELIPVGGKTVQFPLQVLTDCADLEAWWGAYYRGGDPAALPLTHFYITASVVGPVTDSLDTPETPVPVQLTFNGAKRTRLDPGALVGCDPISGSYGPGDEVIVRTYMVGEGALGVLGAAITGTTTGTITGPQLAVTHPLYGKSFYIQVGSEYMLVASGTTGTAWVISERGSGSTTPATHLISVSVGHVIQVPNSKFTNGELNCNSFDGDQTMNGAASTDGLASHFVFTPFVLAAGVFASDLQVVGIVGDSNSQGQGDSGDATGPGGFAERGCIEGGFIPLMMAAGGMGLTAWVTYPYLYWRMLRLFGATVATVALGTNRNSETAEELLDQLDAQIAIAASYGVKVIALTIPPSTDLGDTPGSGEAARLEFNDAIRDVRPGTVGTLDAASYVSAESDGTQSPNGSYWFNDGTDAYGADLHYQLGHVIVAPAYADAVQRAVDGDTNFIVQQAFTAAPPVNTVAPVVSGTAQSGSLLTGTLGSWTGYPTPAKTRKWQREGATNSWADISSATASTYTVQDADVGHRIREAVRAVNASGTVDAFSTPTAAVEAAPTGLRADAITGVVAWIDGSAEVLTNNTSAPTITEFSTNGYDFTQATGANQAVFKTNSQGGFGGFQFDGSNDHYASALPQDAKPRSFLIVIRPTVDGSYRDIFAASESGGLQLRWDPDGFLQLQKDGVTNIATATMALVDGVTVVILVTFGASGGWTFWINGVAAGSGTNNVTPTTATTSLGANASGVEPLKGIVYEGVWVDRDLAIHADGANLIGGAMDYWSIV